MTAVDSAPGGAAAVPDEPADEHAPARGPDLGTVCGLAIALVGLGIGASRIADNSFLTHLATGREMVANGFVREDVFTWTSQGESIVVQSWLASLLYGVVDEVAGFHGLRLLTALLAGVLAVQCWMLTARATSVLTRLAIMVPVLLIGRVTWSERPLLIAFVLLAATLLVVEGRGEPRWLGPVGFIWVGVHGSWPLGLVLLIVRAVGGWLDGEQSDRERQSVKWLLGGMLVGGVLNPYGPALLLFPLELLNRQEVLSHVVEWQSPTFDSLWTRAFLAIVLASMVAAARRARWRTLGPAAVFIAAALLGRRNIPLAAIVVLPVLAGGLPALGRLTARRTSEAIRLASIALAALLVLVPLIAVGAPHLELDRFPEAAITAMEDDLDLAPGETRIIHQDFVGNYLDIRYGDAAAAWIDDRFELHDPALVEDYILLLEGRQGWVEVLDRHGAEAIVWPADAALTQLASEVGGWSTVWSDDDWVVLCHPANHGCRDLTP